jgi:branched-chain amino acid transport system ATP-binding protein
MKSQETLGVAPAGSERRTTNAPASEVLLEGKGISKHFGGVNALTDVDFQVRRGEIVGLIGPNGSGKTTLFNLVSGLIRPDAGRVFFRGRDVTRDAPYTIAGLGVGRTFQIVRPLPDLTLTDNIAVAVLYGREGISDPKAARKRAREILAFEDRKRLEVARALGSKPEVLLLDEVFAGLNSKEAQGAVELTFRIRDECEITVFMIEHVMKAIMETCSRVIALHHGVKIADGPPRETANHPEVIRAYLGTAYAGN